MDTLNLLQNKELFLQISTPIISTKSTFKKRKINVWRVETKIDCNERDEKIFAIYSIIYGAHDTTIRTKLP